MNLPIAIIIAVLGITVLMFLMRGKKTPATATTAVFGLVVVSLMIGGTVFNRQVRTTRENDRRVAAAATAAAAERAYEAQVTQYTSCVSKVATRIDLRVVLFALVDLSDLFPGSAAAEQYTVNRRALIDAKYPLLNLEATCGPVPTAPTSSPPINGS